MGRASSRVMNYRRQLILSFLLVLVAAAVITASDYWTALKTVLDQSELYARRVAAHISLTLIPPETAAGQPLTVPNETIRNVVHSFDLVNIKIFDREGSILFSLDNSFVGMRTTGNRSLALALEGKSSSHLADSEYLENTYGQGTPYALLETYIPVIDPRNGDVLGAYEIYQDYRPLRSQIVSETVLASVTHLILLLVFAGIFYRYGKYQARLMDSGREELIRELEEKIEERTFELKRSRDRVGELLARKEEMFRDLKIADEYKKNFMGLVSHELKTPLTVIKGYLTMMSEGELGPVFSDQKEVVSTCLEESNKLEDIIKNILELSQLERGHFDLTADNFEVHPMIQEALNNLGGERDGRDADIRVEVDDEVAVFVSDRIKILQVMEQFLSNALKFSRAGSPVQVKASASHRGLLLAVKDRGVGIPKGQVDEIFNLFYQVDITTTRNYEGSGLGLAIARKIAQVLGGRVWVESEEGRGSTFYFEVPALSPATGHLKTMGGEEFDALSRPGPEDSRAALPRCILHVDDDTDYLFLLRRLLIDRGYTVEMCKDGLDGLNRLFGPDHPPLPSLIVLDVRLPHINGLDFLRIVRRNVITREIPVIIVSALGQESQVQEGLKAGANAYFVKPAEPEALLGRIDFLLGRETVDADV